MVGKKTGTSESYVEFKFHDQINSQMIYIVIGTTDELTEFQKTILKPSSYNPITAKGALDRCGVSNLLDDIVPKIRHSVIYINKDKCKGRMTRTLYHELLHLYDSVHNCVYLGGAGPKPSQNELLVRVMTYFVFDTPLIGALKYTIEQDSNLTVNSIKL